MCVRTHVEDPAVVRTQLVLERALLGLKVELVVLVDDLHHLGDEQLGSDRVAVGGPAAERRRTNEYGQLQSGRGVRQSATDL